MKIAICMSGQLRSWEIAKENQKWFWTTHHQYSEDNTPDYFIHTWDYSGDRTGVSRPYEMRNVTQKEFDKVIEWYEPKKYIFDKEKNPELFYGNDHWSSLFYSFSQSVMLKRQYELENNFEYDLVIKTRPDLVFHPKQHFIEQYMDDGLVYTTHGGPQESECDLVNYNDCCFYSNSYTMDILVDLYFYRQKVIHDNSGYKDLEYLNFDPLGPGVLMGEFFSEYGICAQILQPMRYKFIETIVKLGCPKNLDLKDPKHFHKMEKYFREWYTK